MQSQHSAITPPAALAHLYPAAPLLRPAPPYRSGSSHPRPALARSLFSYPAPHLPSCPCARRPFLALPRRGDQLTRLNPPPYIHRCARSSYPGVNQKPAPAPSPPAVPPPHHPANFPTSQQVEKSKSRKVGKLAPTTNHRGSPLHNVHTSSHPLPQPYPRVDHHPSAGEHSPVPVARPNVPPPCLRSPLIALCNHCTM